MLEYRLRIDVLCRLIGERGILKKTGHNLGKGTSLISGSGTETNI